MSTNQFCGMGDRLLPSMNRAADFAVLPVTFAALAFALVSPGGVGVITKYRQT